MENSSNSKKRSREEFADSSPGLESKRFRPNLFIEILDDEEEEVDSGVDTLADVMKSLEDEISLLPSSSPLPMSLPPQHDLGYLLEASDDELGLPPTAGSGTPTSDGGDDAVVVVDDDVPEVAGFGRIWEFEDEISGGYGGVDFGFGEPLDIGFGYGFEGGDAADYSGYEESLWRPEYLPAA